MACTIDIDDITRKFINNRPWFKTKDYVYIFITESPKERINDNNLMSVAKRYSKEWNENLMEIIPELKSGIYYPRMEFDDDSGKFLPAIRLFIADDVKLQLQEASKRIMLERELNEKKILEEQARQPQREDAKRAGIEYTDRYLFTEKDGQIRMNFANLTDLIKNNDVRVLDLEAKDNKISNFTKTDIQRLENYADIIPDITREQALKELANIENIDDPGVFYVTSYLTKVFIDRLVDRDGLMFYNFQIPKETGGITPLIRSKLKDVRIVVTKDNLKPGVPFYQYNNAIVIGLKQLNNYTTYGWSLDQLETIMRTVADEEAIHLITEEVTTQKDIDKIYSELSEADIKEIKDIYGSDSLSKEGVVYEYLRMVVQNKIFGTTTEIEVAKVTQTVMDVLRKLIRRLIGFLTTRAPGDFTQTIINDIYNFTKGNISEELASKIEHKVYKGVVAEANIDPHNLTTPVLESLYENSSKSKEFITFVKDLKKMIAIWQNSGKTNEEILEMIKCL